jgi:hypothetical protein
MGFPQLGNIDKSILDTIKSKAGNNLRASQTMPWMRVVSCLGGFLAIETAPTSDSFATRYGNTQKSGRIGVDAAGNSVFADEDSRGLRPSPTIDSISISQGNEGLSKKSSFTVICYTLGQCEKIMEYFLEPGNMVLVEWGENTNASISQKTVIEKCAIASYNSLKTVQTKRRESKGTYDAVLGVITGGGMSYGSNETYEVQVELTSVGELPAYLQHHKGVQTDQEKADSSETFKSWTVDAEKNVGKRLFQQMFNDLPANKRTLDLYNKVNDEFYTDSINFINMDKEIREEVLENVKNTKLMTKGKDIEITSDLPLFTEKRFIRVALAFTILDLQQGIDTHAPGVCGEMDSTSSGCVVWHNTICRAHKNMFSADSDYLYIPNKYAPNFDIVGALRAKDEYKNPLPNIIANKNGNLKFKDTKDVHPKSYGGSKTAYFPNNNKLTFEDQACYDGTYLPLKAEAGQWGYLRDLYINFDFFCDTLEKTGLVTKDVYYELLNGLSSGANLYWNFQIIPRGSIDPHTAGGDTDADTYYNYELKKKVAGKKTGVEELQVVDASFGGIANGSSVGLAKFQSRGALTPFLSAELNFDIPGAMKGQVIGSKLAKKDKKATQNPNSEDKEIRLDGLFSDGIDTVLVELNSVKQKIAEAEADKSETEGEEKTSSEKLEEQREANYEYIVANGTIIPMEQDREQNKDLANESYDYYSGNDTTFEEFAVCAGWNDPQVLKKVQLMNEGLLSGGKSTVGWLNVPLLPIKFNFTIHGVSGIRVGDTFTIIDLPGKYKTKVFQVTQVGHDIAQNLWSTKVEGSMRNMEAGTAK